MLPIERVEALAAAAESCELHMTIDLVDCVVVEPGGNDCRLRSPPASAPCF